MNKSRPIQIKFRLSERENELFKEKVEESGLSQQDYLRLKALGIDIDVDVEPKTEAYLLQKRLEGYEALLKKIFEEKEM